MKILTLAALSAALVCSQAWSQSADSDISVTDAWARATVAQQTASGAFMQLKSTAGAKIVAVKTPVAGVAEVHEMKMDGTTMQMRAMPALALPAGQTVKLEPGGYHVMLMQLRHQLKAGESIPLTLVVENAQGQRRDVSVSVPVKPLGTSASSSANKPMDHSHMQMPMPAMQK